MECPSFLRAAGVFFLVMFASKSRFRFDFYVSDGTQNGVFPTNAIQNLSLVSGKVGIGTTNPQATLEVRGDGNIEFSSAYNHSLTFNK